MGDGGIGLIIGLGADDSAAQAVFPGFSAAAVKATADAGAGMMDLKVHAMESGDAVAAISAKIRELSATRVSPEGLRPLREELVRAQIRGFGEETGYNMREARGAARLLGQEFGVAIPREIATAGAHVEWLGKAMSAAFPVVAVAAFTQVLDKGVGKLQGWLDKLLGIEHVTKEDLAKTIELSAKQVDSNEKILEQLTGRNLQLDAEIAKEYQLTLMQAERGARGAEIDKAQLYAVTRLETGWQMVLGPIGSAQYTAQVIKDYFEASAKATADMASDLATIQQSARDAAVTMALRMVAEAGKGAKERAAGIKETTDRLAELLAKERDQAEALEIGNNKERQLLKTYQDEVRAIDAAVAAAGKKGLSDKQEAEATEAKAQALRNYHTALAQLAPVFPPIVEEMRKIQESLFAEKIHAQALAILGLDDATKKVKLSLPDYSTILKLMGGSLPQVTGATVQLTAAQIASLPTQRELLLIHQNLVKLFPQMTKAEIDAKAAELTRNQGLIQLLVKTEQLHTGTRAYREELKQLIQTIQQLSGAEKQEIGIGQQWVQSLKDEKEAIQQNTVATVQGIAEGVAAQIGGRKAVAAVDGAVDAAKAIEFLAQFIGSWGTDTAAGLAAAKYALAAEEEFRIAGSGSTARASSGGGSGGGGYGASGPAGAANQPMGPTAAGALPAQVGQGPGITSFGSGGGGGPTISGSARIIVYGDNQLAAHIAGVLTDYVQRKGGNLVARQAILPPKAGR